MSTFQMQCPNCGIVLEVEHQYIGVEAACEMCDFHFYVQAPESSSEIKPVASGSLITPQGQSSEKGNYFLPPLSMLSYGDICEEDDSTQLSVIQSTLEEALKTCGIRGQISNCIKGPQVIRFEIKLEPGIYVNKVAQNADNIARSLALQNIRIIAPIPGLSAVGVEIPRNQMYPVFLRDLLESEQWCSSNAAIPIILGKDTANKPVILDLATESPILIAGGLGSGKSTCVNSLIMNLLFRFSPEDLKFIMVDLSGVELNAYNSLPHLLTPVINDDLSKFPTALRWAVGEMEKRYRILSAAKVKRFSDFNARQVAQEPIYDAELGLIPDKMPAIIIIVDGMSDSIISEMQGDIEAPITRIVQNGQRVGIYLIFVTQRPTINVISGTIKAGFLTRICFKVRSYRDSLIIFESKGAEALLGNGDMLCQSFSSKYIERIQCTFTPNSDILKVVEFISAQVPQQFNKEIHRDGDDDWWDSDEEDDDGEDEDNDIPWDIPDISASVRKYMRPGDSEVVQQALEVVILERKASTSYLQRRLGIGYNRAAELLDQMEERGIVGPSSGWGNKREILILTE